MDPTDRTRLPIAGIVPGLVVIAALDLIAVAGMGEQFNWLVLSSPWLMLAIPWAVLAVARHPVADLGFRGHRAIARFGWGLLAGALWRGASLALNVWWAAPPDRLGVSIGDWLVGLVWVPFVEETFYRGYLGLGLRSRFGEVGAVLIQAVLFTLHPVHWSQGMPHVISIFVFGVLAGALVMRTRSIWSGWGAHAMANVLPTILILASRG